MLAPMAVLALGCVAVGFLAPQVVAAMKPVIGSRHGFGEQPLVEGGLSLAIEPLRWVVPASGIFVLILGLLVWLRHRLLAGREVSLSGTWDCGYARPTATHAIHGIIICPAAHEHVRLLPPDPTPIRGPRRFFPGACRPAYGNRRSFSRKPFSASLSRYRVALTLAAIGCNKGRVQLYILYVAVTLLVLLVWNLR